MSPLDKSSLNLEFDIPLFFKIIRNSIVGILVIFIITSIISFLYLRYTRPMYEATSILQLSSSNTAEKVLKTSSDMVDETDLPGTVELLKSNMFLQQVFMNLPLRESYYLRGRILNLELYKNTPFVVESKIYNNSIYGCMFEVKFLNSYKYTISYTYKDRTLTKEAYLNQTVTFPELQLILKRNYESPLEISSEEEYFFIINNPNNIANQYVNYIDVNILNPIAKTIFVTVQDANPVKAADIANEITKQFIKYDVSRKAESSNNILKEHH